MGVHALQGSPEWTIEDLIKAWSQEALYHVDVNVKLVLGSRLGSIKEREQAS
jgi:hypothetical protein